MDNNESLFASLHILMLAIPDGPENAGRRLHRYWYRGSRCQVHTGWQKLCALCGYKSVKICVNPVNPVIPSNLSSCLRGEKIREIRVNPWFIKDLRLCKALYNCRETFTDVMSALQIRLFMQNKANFRKVKLNVNKVLTRDYVQMDTWSIGKNKPNSNPIKANLSRRSLWRSRIKPNLSRRSLWRRRKQIQFHMILVYFSSRAVLICVNPWLMIKSLSCLWVLVAKNCHTVKKSLPFIRLLLYITGF
jgi:hypothetical protein